MRHKKKRRQLNRFTSWHKATLVSLAKNLLIRQSIKTSLVKAKAVKPLVERLIFLAKSNSLAAKRRAFKILCDHKLVSQLFNEIGPRFINRASGFTRTINIGLRRGDNASIVIFELTEIKKKEPKLPKKEKEKEIRPPEEGQTIPLKEEKTSQKPETKVALKEKPPVIKKPAGKFLGGLRKIFKKQRDSL